MKEFFKNVPNSLKYPAEYIAYFLSHSVFGEGHMYKPKVCTTKLLNILTLEIFNSFVLFKSI